MRGYPSQLRGDYPIPPPLRKNLLNRIYMAPKGWGIIFLSMIRPKMNNLFHIPSSDETVPNVVKQNACPHVERPPRILLMEISTRFFDLLEGGDEAQPGKNLRSRKGTFFKAGMNHKLINVCIISY